MEPERRTGTDRDAWRRASARRDAGWLLVIGLLAVAVRWLEAAGGSTMTGLWSLLVLLIVVPALVPAILLIVFSRGVPVPTGRALVSRIAAGVLALAVNGSLVVPSLAGILVLLGAMGAGAGVVEILAVAFVVFALPCLTAAAGALLLARLDRRGRVR